MSANAKPAEKPEFTEKDITALFKTLYEYLDRRFDVYYDNGADSLAAFTAYISEYVIEVHRAETDQLEEEDGESEESDGDAGGEK